ncbi:uncharacterized protein BJ171DRAFT_505927 [Polychytrium aggregatum]|uniref:uncharacterized protein n=1 Tax=Polychytrium aggregatum TaxID=110093 RepID=UPI0022FEEE60|nr:uncharacterized protein BJ171DRAFT_505927 [Polychytrium aggregatum]KAI9204483.1 hypothetical protein BJ171DRAFT_505927 [Polychytrium aggregatum]
MLGPHELALSASPHSLPDSATRSIGQELLTPPMAWTPRSEVEDEFKFNVVNHDLLSSPKFSYFITNVLFQVLYSEPHQPVTQFDPESFQMAHRLIHTLLQKVSHTMTVSIVLASIILLERVAHAKVFQLSKGSEYLMFVVALIIANKLQDDYAWTNKSWTSLSGIQATKLSLRERQFLKVLHYDLSVNQARYDCWERYFKSNQFYCK